jgi:hypothetical protein
MLCHVYTWGHIVIVASVFLTISFLSSLLSAQRLTPDFRLKALLLAIAIVSSVVVDYVKSEAAGVPSGLSRDTGVAGYSFSLDNFNSRWTTLSDTLGGYVGGYLSVPILLALSLFWVLRVRKASGGDNNDDTINGKNRGSNNQRRRSSSIDRVILSMFFVLAIPILFGSMTVQARLLYNTPFFIPAALVLFGASRARLIALLSITLVTLVLANYAADAMSNLNLVVPDNAILDNPFLVP